MGLLVGDAANMVGASAQGGDDRLSGTGTLIGDSAFGLEGVGGNDRLDAGGSTEGSRLVGDTG